VRHQRRCRAVGCLFEPVATALTLERCVLLQQQPPEPSDRAGGHQRHAKEHCEHLARRAEPVTGSIGRRARRSGNRPRRAVREVVPGAGRGLARGGFVQQPNTYDQGVQIPSDWLGTFGARPRRDSHSLSRPRLALERLVERAVRSQSREHKMGLAWAALDFWAGRWPTIRSFHQVERRGGLPNVPKPTSPERWL